MKEKYVPFQIQRKNYLFGFARKGQFFLVSLKLQHGCRTILLHFLSEAMNQDYFCLMLFVVVKLGSRSKVYLKSLIRDLDLELVAIIAMSPPPPPTIKLF